MDQPGAAGRGPLPSDSEADFARQRAQRPLLPGGAAAATGDADDDDRQIGRILSRREVFALVGGVGMAAAARAAVFGSGRLGPSAAAPVPAVAAQALSWVVRPEVTEGPYYVAEDLVRSDIRSDPGTGTVKEGTPLTLTFNVSEVSGTACSPLEGATVEVWHCDAAGLYSDVADPGFNTKGQQFLRGAQVTDANGTATFTTIYPGWYRGRAVHIHFKIRPNANTVFTSQLFFDDALSNQVFAQAPYASKGRPDTPNSRDGIYQEQLLLTVTPAEEGYAATFPIGVDLASLGAGQSSGGGPRSRPVAGGRGGR
jgi:protocatechuate 3,4-dioxygenase beta subunit